MESPSGLGSDGPTGSQRVGKHWGSGRDTESPSAWATAVRALTACAAIVAAAFALGLPSVPGLQPGSAVPKPGAGHVGVPALAPVIQTDGRALVPFARTLVRTVAKDGQAPLNVASAQLSRPPEGSLMAPLEILEPSSPFGLRISPISGQGGDFHLGQDFAAGCGTRVYAADAGVVRAAGWHPWGGGNRVEIDHGNGLITTYNHLQAVAVHTGDSVQVGQLIARVGTTGWSTGCHLHFETILHGVHTNPLNWTLLPIHQVDMLADISMVSYEGKDAATSQPWAIPVAADNSHAVLHGEDELPAPPAATEPATTPTEAATPAAPSSPTETATPPGTATPTPPGTATPTPPASTPPSPSGTATPTPPATKPPTPPATKPPTATGTATPSPSGTATPTGTATPSPTATGTATPSASPSGTTTPAGSAPPPPEASSPTTTAPAAPRPAAPVATSAPAARTPSESEQPVTPPSTTQAAAAPPGTTTPSAEPTSTTSAAEPTPTKP